MRRRPPRASLALVLLGAALAVAGTLLLRSHLDRLAARAAAVGPGRTVVVAVVDLERGAVVRPEMLGTREVPPRYLPPGALTAADQAVGRSLAADVTAGEVLTAARLGSEGGPVASLVPPGLRAMSITAGIPPAMIAPGDRVDVLATYATGQPFTETVAEAAEVMVVRPSTGDAFGQGATLLLLVGPETAERLAYARAFADLAVALAPPQELGS